MASQGINRNDESAPRPSVPRLCVVFIFVLFSSLAVAAQELTNPLTADEVACNERQLERLLQRMSGAKGGEYHPPELPTILFVSYSNSSGFYDGMVATDQEFRVGVNEPIPPRPYEHYLAFNINPSVRTLLLNPRRPELPQVTLSREQTKSNLVAPGSIYEITLTLDPSLGKGQRATINNFIEPRIGAPYNGFLASSTREGRGLIADGLVSPCHTKLTDFDRHVFSILQRIARPRALDEILLPDMEVAIFRGEDPHVYRLNFYPIFAFLEGRGRMAVELRVNWDEGGRLTMAESRVLGVCVTEGQLGCTSLERAAVRWFLIPPILGGAEHYDSSKVEDGGFYYPSEGASGPRTVNLERLLANSTWNRSAW